MQLHLECPQAYHQEFLNNLRTKAQRPVACHLLLTALQQPQHPPQAYHQEFLNNLRAAMKRSGRVAACVMDTLGPEIVVLNR